MAGIAQGDCPRGHARRPHVQPGYDAEKIGFLSSGIAVKMVILIRMEEPMNRTVFRLAGLGVALFAAPAIAHHAFAMFDSSKMLYMTGTVKQFDYQPAYLASPHHRQRQGRRFDMAV